MSQRFLSEPVGRALECTIKAMTREYSRIPFRVRFRASGALDAWARLRREAGEQGARLDKGLGNVRTNPSDLIRETVALVYTGSEPGYREDATSLVAAVSTSVPPQAFWLRGGALFEPTDALEQLLKLSDVSDDLPLAAVARNARAIVPARDCVRCPTVLTRS